MSILFLAHVVLPIALPLMDCLNLLLKLGRTLRGKVSCIFTLEALDVSIIFLFILILAHHLGILIRSLSGTNTRVPKEDELMIIKH